MKKIVSPIAIDMGAKYSGLFLAHYGDLDTLKNEPHRKIGAVLNVDQNFTWSQEARTARRHQTRGYKRRKMAKRLFWLIWVEGYGLPKPGDQLGRELTIWLSGLLNRRGFTYLTDEVDEEILKMADPRLISHLSGGLFSADTGVLDQMLELPANPEALNRLVDQEFTGLGKKDRKKFVKERLAEIDETDPDLVADTQEQFQQICDGILALKKSLKDGHRPRSDYFENIQADLKARSAELKKVLSTGGLSVAGLANTIANISNLQLRVLRKYFNDPTMKSGDTWQPDKLRQLVRKWLRGWHTKADTPESENRREALATLKNSSDILQFFREFDPQKTIPPYEDQNNRRPPRCQNVFLDTLKLDKEFPGWDQLAEKFLSLKENQNGELPIESDIELPNSLANRVRRRKRKAKQERVARQLQRLLERNKLVDPFHVRDVARTCNQAGVDPRKKGLKSVLENPTNRETEWLEAERDLGREMGSALAKELLALACRFFQETDAARKGLWYTEMPGSILRECGDKPRQKKNQAHLLVNHILGTNFQGVEQADFTRFRKNWRGLKVHGNTRLGGFAKKIETVRKSLGNGFKHEYDLLSSLLRKQPKLKAGEIDKDQKEIKSIIEKLDLAVDALGDYLEHTPAQRERYRNPFSLAQLHNILEGDVQGFTKTCQACTVENNWRGEMMEVKLSRSIRGVRQEPEGKLVARAVRLSANSGRPFDGQLARLMDRLAYETARLKARQISKLGDVGKNTQLRIPIIIESNDFQFEEGLADIKNNKTKKDNAKKKGDRFYDRLASKSERIRAASQNICPYSGKAIGDRGEVDHIIPRSFSRKLSGTVFNSEANLIYCSATGNQQKGNRWFSLHDLSPKYLKKVYGTDNAAEIQGIIASTLEELEKEGRRRLIYPALTLNQQRDLRHALFCAEDKIRFQAMDLLNTGYKARVNGTQAFFVKELQRKLTGELKKVGVTQVPVFEVAKVSGEDTQKCRDEIVKKYPVLEKNREAQPLGSHVVDAFAAFWQQAMLPEGTYLYSAEDPAAEEFDQYKNMAFYLPAGFVNQEVLARPKFRKDKIWEKSIFKDTIYGERFLPVIVDKGRVFVGFSRKKIKKAINAVEIPGPAGEYFYETLRPLLRYKKTEPAPEWAEAKEKANTYFTVERQAAVALLHRAAKEKLPEEERELARLLGQLYYTIVKAEVAGQIHKPDGKFNSEKDIMKPENFRVKFEFKPPGKLGKKIDGHVLLPAREKWQEIMGYLKSWGVWKDSKMKFGDIPRADWERMLKEVFDHWENRQDRKHFAVRKVFSLPMVANPSGGFRVKRKAGDFSGQSVYQLVAVEGFASQGFAKEGNQVDFKREVALETLKKSPHLSPKGELVESEQPGSVPTAMYDDWRSVEVPAEYQSQGVQAVWMAPGSKDRQDIICQMSKEYFDREILGVNGSSSIFSLPGRRKGKEFCQAGLFTEFLKKPRSDEFRLFSFTDSAISIRFKPQNSDENLKALYNEGQPVEFSEIMDRLWFT